ncbi:YHS domain-containing (seleno)protein [Litorisediminicola beolgyonensis]|uniref:YHS domain-containing (Seleno)protein n=1 Tax=Litorisediminicola beolgyonensis TaxID=1173614 RepID=A0ABW3ZG98_9RHOB
MPIDRRQFILLAAAAPIIAWAGVPGFAQGAAPIYAENGIAIDGTDPIAYFTEGRPVPGSADIALEWRGATWRFASEANRDAFIANPTAYAPQFGGYCAWAVAEGYTASTVPDAWRIVDGKLYLNYSRGIQKRWEGDVPGNIARGNANWPELSGRS